MMEYTYLKEAGMLSIHFNGKPLDTYSLGILQLNLQEIFDKVAYSDLEVEGLYHRRLKRYLSRNVFAPCYVYSSQKTTGLLKRILTKYLPKKVIVTNSDIRIIRAEIKSINVGSLIENVCFLIPAVLADPNVRAVLQGLASNIIYAIGTSGVRGVIYNDDSNQKSKSYTDVGDNVRGIAQILAENEGGKICFESEYPSGDKETVTIEVN
ncbi:MAG: hypothetical protein MI685_12120 [Chlorobiales bacterium]|nr:hypothetical protein [Chlorobiales bacterium]